MKDLFLIKKSFCCLLLLVLGSFPFTHAQEDLLKNGFVDELRFGGSVGLSFSNGFFNANLAPKAIYDFNQYSSVGMGLLGSYTSATNYKAYNFGGSIIGILRPLPALQLSTEFEELHVTRNFELDGANKKESYWYPALFLGLGYINGPVVIGARYDILYDEEKSIYGTALMPFVSFYF